MKPIISFRKAIENPQLLGRDLDDSWAPMRALALAAMGEELTPIEREHFKRLTQRDHEPLQRVRNFVVCSGRRSGKSRISAILALYLALFCDHSENLVVGEKGVVLCIAQNMEQAKIVFGYVTGLVNRSQSCAKKLTASQRSDWFQEWHFNSGSPRLIPWLARHDLRCCDLRRNRFLVSRS